jgi:hypothetical protein
MTEKISGWDTAYPNPIAIDPLITPLPEGEGSRPHIRGMSTAHNSDDYPALMHAHSRGDGRRIPARREADPSAF